METVIEPATEIPASQKPKRQSGYARMKRRALAAEAQNREETEEASEEPDKPRRESQNKRLKRKILRLEREVNALEALAHRLLDHLEAATLDDLTDRQRQGYRNLIFDVRRNLSLTE